MKVLFTTLAHKTHFYPMVPTAWALRAAGHEVRVASRPDLTNDIVHTGLTAVPAGPPEAADDVTAQIGEEAMWYVYDFDFPRTDPGSWTWENLLTLENIQVPVLYAALNDAMVDDLVAYARAWQPDLIIWETFTVAGAIAARVTDTPHARLVWGPDISLQARQEFLQLAAGQPDHLREDPTAEWLEHTLSRYGKDFDETLLTGEWTIDPTPPCSRLNLGLNTLGTQWIAYNGPATVPDWLREPAKRPRICLTLGLSIDDEMGEFLGGVLAALSDLDIEVVATLDAAQQAALGELPGNVRAVEFVPLHDLLPTCAAIVHHGGCGTRATAAAHGIPQLILAYGGDVVVTAERIARFGAGLWIAFDEEITPELVRANVVRLLEDDELLKGAQRLRQEMLAEPTPSELVRTLEKLISS